MEFVQIGGALDGVELVVDVLTAADGISEETAALDGTMTEEMAAGH